MSSEHTRKPGRERKETEAQTESRRILERVARDSEAIGTSSLARVAGRAASHFGASDADPDDAAEVWGKRIARILALLAVLWLAYHIVTTYILP